MADNDFQKRRRLNPPPPIPEPEQIGTREEVIAGQHVTVRVFAPGGVRYGRETIPCLFGHDGGARAARRRGT